jgi:hypothetical protein
MTPHPPELVETSAMPSPSERAFTPVFDGLWGEGKYGTIYTTGERPPSTLIAVPVM